MVLTRTAAAGSLESSDALVTISPSDELTIEIESVVKRQFGDAIERAVRETLAAQGVTGAFVHIDDKGALECTLTARVEAAILRAREGQA